MLRTTILTRTDGIGRAFVVACREGVVVAELTPWWAQLTDHFGIVLSSANDDYRSASYKS